MQVNCPKHGKPFDADLGCPDCLEERNAAVRETTLEEIYADGNPGIESLGKVVTALALRPGEDVEVRGQYTESLAMLKCAQSTTITTPEASKRVAADLAIIGTFKRAMEAKRKEKLAPHREAADAVQETYKFLMGPILEAEQILKGVQVLWLQEQQRIAREQEAINLKRRQAAEDEMRLKGELSESLEEIEVQAAPKTVRTELGTTSMVDHWTYEIVDVELIPRPYMMPDSVLLGDTAKKYHDQKAIPGVRFYNKPFISTRSR